MCERFHCLPEPGGLYDQDTELISLVQIQALGTREEYPDDEPG